MLPEIRSTLSALWVGPPAHTRVTSTYSPGTCNCSKAVATRDFLKLGLWLEQEWYVCSARLVTGFIITRKEVRGAFNKEIRK